MMKYDDIMKLYSYICSFESEGVSVGELIKKFNIKKRDIISFLKVMSNFSNNIDFHYYSPDEDVEYEDFDDIDEKTIIDINDKIIMLKEILIKEANSTGKVFMQDLNKIYFRQEG